MRRHFWRGHADASEEGPERNLYPVREARHHALAVERDDLHARVGEVFRKETSSRAEGVVGVRYRQPDLFDPHFECVARLRALDEDGAGQDVPARPLVRGHSRQIYTNAHEA